MTTAKIVPNFPAYSFDGTNLRRVSRGQGARVGIKRPHPGRFRQAIYQLFKDGKPTFMSKAALTELTFGTDETLSKHVRGEEWYNHKLTDKDVLNIRHLAGHLSSRQIVAALGLKVDSRAVRHVISGDSWKHLQ